MVAQVPAESAGPARLKIQDIQKASQNQPQTRTAKPDGGSKVKAFNDTVQGIKDSSPKTVAEDVKTTNRAVRKRRPAGSRPQPVKYELKDDNYDKHATRYTHLDGTPLSPERIAFRRMAAEHPDRHKNPNPMTKEQLAKDGSHPGALLKMMNRVPAAKAAREAAAKKGKPDIRDDWDKSQRAKKGK